MNNIIKVYNFFNLILLNKIMNDKANDFNYYQSICYMLEEMVCICLPYLNMSCTRNYM